MLVSFTVQNYRSIYEPVTLDMTIPNIEINANNPYVQEINGELISKLGILYGHNGAGKSNILSALTNLLSGLIPEKKNKNIKKLAEHHKAFGNEKESIFKLVFYSNLILLTDSEKKKTFDKFDIHQKLERPYKKYQYELKIESIIKKSAIENSEKKEIKISYEHLECLTDTVSIFKRKDEKIISDTAEIFSPGQEIPMDTLALVFLLSFPEKSIKASNYLLLCSRLVPNVNLDLDMLNMPNISESFISYIYPILKKEKLLKFYMEVLQIADVGISEIMMESETENELFDHKETLVNTLSTLNLMRNNANKILNKKQYNVIQSMLDAVNILNDIVVEDLQPQEKQKLYSLRTSINGTVWKALFNEIESDGTKIFASNLASIVFSLRDGSIAIKDELLGIQSDLITTLISLFKKDKFEDSNPYAQLLMSTHDTRQMGVGNMLTNFFWIVEKEEHQSTLYNISQFENVNSKNMMDSYNQNNLGGKYSPQYHLLPKRINQ